MDGCHQFRMKHSNFPKIVMVLLFVLAALFYFSLRLPPFSPSSSSSSSLSDLKVKLKDLRFIRAVSHKIARFTPNPRRHLLKPHLAGQLDVFGIVFDAGSTGTRLHVIHLKKENASSSVSAASRASASSSNTYKLIDEFVKKIKPGISSYADNPQAAALSLAPLLSLAKQRIPAHRWRHTPVSLRATAGLRLLPRDQADAILAAIRRALAASPFHLLTGSEGVGILDGELEGIFGWLTLNFAARTLTRVLERPGDTFGALDLGGGSTQISFVPGAPDTLVKAPRAFIKRYPVSEDGKHVRLYTHSYLGLGLMAARRSVMTGAAPDATRLSSPCLFTAAKWRYAGTLYETGPDEAANQNKSARFLLCYAAAKHLILRSSVHSAAPELNARRFFAFSYFADRLRDAAVNPAEFGSDSDVPVRVFLESAKTECSRAAATRPFLCMDLTYMAALLLEGYKFKPEKTLRLKKSVNGIELSWSLGAMFHMMHLKEMQSLSS